jgi:hypothetical protein
MRRRENRGAGQELGNFNSDAADREGGEDNKQSGRSRPAEFPWCREKGREIEKNRGWMARLGGLCRVSLVQGKKQGKQEN